MEIRLLGPLEVLDDRGEPVVVSGQRPRALLAVLALNANRPVSTRELISALWGVGAPQAARESIHVFVHHLRKALGRHGAAAMLQTQGTGYLLAVEPEQVDAARFQRLVGQARAAHAQGALPAAWEVFGQALGLWRGAALSDFSQEPFAGSEIARLERLRLAATEEQFRVGLGLGRHAELTGELEALVAEHPLREGLRELLMLALYRSGRQVEALEAYRAARAVLMEQQGVEPGSVLQRLEQAILGQDPRLDLPPQPPAHDTAGVTPGPRPTAGAPAAAPGPQPSGPARRHEERKPVTVLVVAFEPGVGLDPEDVRDQLAGVTGRVRALAARYGGILPAEAARLGRVVAVFGATRSREDDPERAVRAALDLADEAGPAAERVRVGVGVATGEAVVTVTGDPAAQAEPAAVAGDVLGTAGTLAAEAKLGTVSVGPDTYRATRRVIQYRPARSAKEGPAGTAAWEALAPWARTGAHVDATVGPLVERERALATLSRALERFLHDRRLQLVTLVSEPGLGKSRLVAELGRLVDAAPELVAWRVGRCPPIGEGPFQALAEIIKAQVGILEGGAGEVSRGALQQAVTQAVPDPLSAVQIIDSLNALLGAGTAEQPSGKRKELFDGWARFLGATADLRPLVVVFEDLQWADDALLEFVEELLEQLGPAPLLLVATGRPELLDRRPSWGGGQRNAVTLSLSPLSRGGTGMLLDALLEGEPLPEDTREALLAAAGGNPLYVEEYVHAVARHDPRPRQAGEPLPMPQTVQQVIAARIDTLPVDDKLLLQDAAVLGETGWSGALAAVSGRERAEVEVSLRSLQHREFLRRVRATSVTGETEYAFRHPLIREVAYHQLLRARRAGKHQRAAEWLTAVSDPGRAEQIAYHYQQALNLTRAAGRPVEHLTGPARLALKAAGVRSAALGVLVTAGDYYEQALELWPHDAPDRPDLLLRLGQARARGSFTGEPALLAARDAFEAAGESGRAAEACSLLSFVARMRGDTAAAQAHLQRATRLAGSGPATRAAASVLVEIAQDHMMADRNEPAVRIGGQVLRMAAELGLTDVEAAARATVGATRVKVGDLGALPELDQAIAVLESRHDQTALSWHFARMWALYQYGDLAASAEALAAGRRAADASGPNDFDLLMGAHAAILAHAAGRWDRALEILDPYLDRWGHLGMAFTSWGRMLRGSIRLDRGDTPGAVEDGTAAVASLPPDPYAKTLQVPLALLAHALHVAGRDDEAGEALQRLLTDLETRPEQSLATIDLAVLLVERDQPGALPADLAPNRWHRAVRAFVARDFTRAAELYAEIGALPEQAVARLYAARQLAAGGEPDRAAAEAGAAAAFWERVGAAARLRDARSLLDAAR